MGVCKNNGGKNVVEERVINTLEGKFKVHIEVEPLMVPRNTMYKIAPNIDEPLYTVNSILKVRWEPLRGD